MISMKYSKEYRTDVEFDSNGRAHDKVTYVGPEFELSETEEKHKKNRVMMLAGAILAAVLFVVSVLLYGEITKKYYVIIPYAINILLIYLDIESIIIYWPVRERLERMQKERGIDRAKGMSLMVAIVSFYSFVAGVVTIVCNHTTMLSGDWCFLVCTLVISTIMTLSFLYTISTKPSEIHKNIEKNGDMS